MMRTALIVVLVLLLAGVAAATAGGDFYVNSTEPGFLKDIGPKDPRTDNPVAAGITALVVAAVIARGILAARD